jgi:F-type H+-transporting ATPase subunit b
MDTIFYFKLFNFAVFGTLLFVLLRRPLRDFWKIRANEIGFQIKESVDLREKAEAQFKVSHENVERIDFEMQGLIKQLREEGDLEKKKLKEKAEVFAEHLVEDSKRLIDQEVRKTKELLRAEVARLTEHYARMAIQKDMNPDDEKRLINNYLNELQQTGDRAS